MTTSNTLLLWNCKDQEKQIGIKKKKKKVKRSHEAVKGDFKAVHSAQSVWVSSSQKRAQTKKQQAKLSWNSVPALSEA